MVIENESELQKYSLRQKKNYHVLWLLFDAIYGEKFLSKSGQSTLCWALCSTIQKIISKNVFFYGFFISFFFYDFMQFYSFALSILCDITNYFFALLFLLFGALCLGENLIDYIFMRTYMLIN